MNKLIIDSNDAAMAPIILKKIQKEEIEYEIKSLDCGDYIWDTDPQIIIERKTPSDFCSSLKNHHIHSQAVRMSKKSKYNYIIVVGETRSLHFDKRHSMNMFLGGEATLGIMGAKILYCNSNTEFIKLIIKLKEKFEKRDKSKLLQEDFVFKHRKADKLIKLCMTVPLISIEKASRIRKMYPTLCDLIGALNKDTFKVNGLGKTSIKHLKTVFLDGF